MSCVRIPIFPSLLVLKIYSSRNVYFLDFLGTDSVYRNTAMVYAFWGFYNTILYPSISPNYYS